MMRISMIALTVSLLVISCGKGEKEEQKYKIQSYEKQETPSADVAHLQKADQNQKAIAQAAESSDKNNNANAASAKSKTTSTTTENQNKQPIANQDDVVEIYLTGNDRMKYNKEKLKVEAGSTVKLVFEHVGEMSVQTMGHNFVLLDEGVDKMAFGQKAASYASDGYIPPETDKVIAHTEMIGGGEKVTITFEAPSKGTYDYICSFPGHVALMNGKFIVT